MTPGASPLPHARPAGSGHAQPLPSKEGKMGWETRSLHKLAPGHRQAVVELMRAWLHGGVWQAPRDLEWRTTFEYFERTGLSGIAGDLAMRGWEAPAELTSAVVGRYLSNSLYHEQALGACRLLEETAQAHNLGLVVLKGPALVAQGYVDGGVRPYGDLDMFLPTREQALTLLAALGVQEEAPWAKRGWAARLGEAELSEATVRGWPVEFRYCIPYQGEPVFYFLEWWAERLMPVPGQDHQILAPDPSLHMIFLILHMAFNHMFCRLMWFLDLVVLARTMAGHIDWEFVQRELYRLDSANAGHAVARWCARNLDPDFPQLEPRLPAWNYSLLNRMTTTETILSGTFQLHHRNWWQPIWEATFGMLGYVLVSDPGPHGSAWRSPGMKFSLNRFRVAFNIKKPIKILDIVIGFLINVFLFPAACLFARFMGRPKPGQPQE